MPVIHPIIADRPSLVPGPAPADLRLRTLRLAGLVGLLSICFWRPIFDLGRLAATSDLYSHVILIPVVVLYLVWVKRTELNITSQNRGFPLLGIAFSLIALVTLCIYWPNRTGLPINDYLSFTVLAYVCSLIAAAAFALGSGVTRQLLLPLCFLLLMVPFPTPVEHAIEMFFQYTSADAAAVLFNLSGTPTLRDGLTFQVPAVTIRVAQECSGIRSSLVLFITSAIAGYIFLCTAWKRALLTLFVIPLGIVRNAFRIWLLAVLCDYIDPTILHSPLHKRGGPLFFALSLIPFFALLLWLWRSERKALKAKTAPLSDLGSRTSDL